MASRAMEFWKSQQAARARVKDAYSRAEEMGDIFASTPHGTPDIIYAPTQSVGTPRRTTAMQYWKDEQVMRVEWRDGGTPYYYYDVPLSVAKRFIKVKSPGRFINRVMNDYPYGPES